MSEFLKKWWWAILLVMVLVLASLWGLNKMVGAGRPAAFNVTDCPDTDAAEKVVEKEVVVKKEVVIVKEVVVGTTPAPSSPSSQPTGYCLVNGQTDQQALNWEAGQGRLWMADHVVQQLKVEGGDCWVQFAGPTTFTLNSIEGSITADGRSVTNGNGLLVTANRLEVIYSGTIADGFDLWVKSTTAAAPTAVPTATPVPDTPGARGSCTWNGVQHDMTWDPGKNRLWMPWYEDGKQANQAQAIPCHLHAAVPGIREALGENTPMTTGDDWYYTFPVADPSFGFAWQEN